MTESSANRHGDRSGNRAGLPRAVWLLSWISFLADVSSELLYPLLPLFFVVVLGATKTQLGLTEGVAALLVAALAAWSGSRSDRFRRRVPWLRWGYGLPVLGKSLIAVATVWPVALAGRWLDRVGKGLRGSPRDALIADLVGPAMRGRAFGLHRAFDTAGALIGVLIAAGLLWCLTGNPVSEGESVEAAAGRAVPPWAYRVVIAVSAALGLTSWLVTWLVREAAPPASESVAREVKKGVEREESTQASATDHLEAAAHHGGWMGLPGRFWRVLAIMAIFALANSSDAFLLLRANELGFSPWAVVMIYAVFNFTYAGISYPAGAWSDRWGRWRVIGVGWSLYVVVYMGMALVPPSACHWVWPLMALYGVYMALTEGVGKALIADQAPAAARGRALGIFHATNGCCMLVASLLVGWIWDLFSGSIALAFSGAMAGAALVVLALVAGGTKVQAN